MPNTHYMQELSRMHYDYYLDAVESGTPTAYPHCLGLPKGGIPGSRSSEADSNEVVGTSIPSSLILFREQNSWFSLQPSHPMPLTGTLDFRPSLRQANLLIPCL